MKKLMTLMGVTAFALGAFAGTYENKVGFETYALNSGVSSVEGKETYVNSKGTTVEEATLWYCADGDGDSKVEKYGDAAKYDYGSSGSLVVNGPGSQYLSVSTSGNNPLYRTLAHVPDGEEPTQQSLDGDIVADTLVQFTASPTAQTPETGAKFALWLLGEDPQEVDSPKTNLVVTAGSYDGTTVTPANYNLDVANVSPDQWYRVTVRAVNGIGTMQNSKVGMGFVVYINGTVVTCADADYADTFGTVDAELSPEAIILKDRKQLFPSMVFDNERTLAGVGFQGTGKVDDLSIVDGTAAPSFVEPTTGFVITWSEGVVSFKVGADTYTTANEDKGYVIVEPVNGAVAITDVVYANSYSKGTWEKKYATLSGETFTLSGNAASGKIVATTSVFEINGMSYQTFGAALAAAADAGSAVTIKAVADFTAALADFQPGSEFYTITTDVTLDLAGHTISDTSERATQAAYVLFYADEGGLLTVIDSVGGGKIVGSTEALFDQQNGGVVIIGAATGDEGVTVDGTIAYEESDVSLVRGFFNDTGAAALVAEGSTISPEPEAGFYAVTPGSTPSEPTTYTVTFVDYDGTEIASGDVEEGVTPTAPAEDPTRTGYTFTGWYPTIEAVTSNTTYTATYSADTYTVKFYTNSVEYATATYTYGDAATYTAPADPVVDGFKFGGWFTDNGTFETAFVFSANVAGNTQVAYAKLTESGSYPSYIPTEDDAVKA